MGVRQPPCSYQTEDSFNRFENYMFFLRFFGLSGKVVIQWSDQVKPLPQDYLDT